MCCYVHTYISESMYTNKLYICDIYIHIHICICTYIYEYAFISYIKDTIYIYIIYHLDIIDASRINNICTYIYNICDVYDIIRCTLYILHITYITYRL